MGFNSMVSTQNLTIGRFTVEELDEAIKILENRGYTLISKGSGRANDSSNRLKHIAVMRKTPS